MTDRETLFTYRFVQAEETLAEAERMLQEGFSARSIVNRAYYAVFYGLLALFIHTGIEHKTSKHSGIISIFDREFILAGRIDRRFSKIVHLLFEKRQKADYKELVQLSEEDARTAVGQAQEAISGLREFIRLREQDAE